VYYDKEFPYNLPHCTEL